MRQETINLKFRFCGYDLVRAGREASLSIVEGSISLRKLFAGRDWSLRRHEAERLAALEDLAERDPHLHVEVRTGTDGVARVFAMRLGDWGCGCEIHRERRRKLCEVIDEVVARTRSFDRAMQSVTRDAGAAPDAIRKLEDQALKLAGDGADGSSKGGRLVEAPGGAVSGESGAGPGAVRSPLPPDAGAGTASPDYSTAGDGAAGQVRAGCGPEEVQR
ncbi:MAG TPA: hypothetical protein VHZ54_14040, partial [Solirubrobacterales bacterium]|nr:hypothetical protein [Solirubrobacterales bacterium]